MCHGFRQPWIPIRQAGKRHFTREEKGIETIATMTVLKKEWPDSLGADIYNEISEVQKFYCYVIFLIFFFIEYLCHKHTKPESTGQRQMKIAYC